MKVLRELSWAPVRRGKYYCAPACGARCTIFQHDHAVMLANQAAKQLGKNWKPYVNENMGWFASVDHVSGCLKISVNEYEGSLSYTAFLGEPGSPGGKWAERGDTPEAAIETVCEVAHAEIMQRQKTATLQLELIESESLYSKRSR